MKICVKGVLNGCHLPIIHSVPEKAVILVGLWSGTLWGGKSHSLHMRNMWVVSLKKKRVEYNVFLFRLCFTNSGK